MPRQAYITNIYDTILLLSSVLESGVKSKYHFGRTIHMYTTCMYIGSLAEYYFALRTDVTSIGSHCTWSVERSLAEVLN